MEPKFKPRIPPARAKGRAAQNASQKQEVKLEQAPVPPVVEEAKPEIKAESQAEEMIDLKPESMEYVFDDMDIQLKLENGAVVWEGLDGSDTAEPMDIDVKENVKDRVVREIEVHLTPAIDQETKLYLLQYPLRPYWRPYDLEERCQEVRVKHQHNKLEVDLVVDNFGDNYDQRADDHLKITKQTLTSTQGNLSTNYAVGILQGNKLYLNPVHAIVQLRPSLGYLNEADEKKKKSITRIESDDEMPDADADKEEPEAKPQPVPIKVEIKKQETERQQQSRLMSYAHLKQIEEAEPWIALEPHGFDSPITEEIRTKMKASGDSFVRFGMHPNEYLKSLVPGRPTSTPVSNIKLGKESLSKSYLDTLPLDQRLQAVLSQGRVHVLQFERLMKLAPPGCTEDAVLNVLQRTAYLVQGCWVALSKMRYTGPICVIRDYILLQFVKNRVVSRETLEELNVSKDVLREILLPLAVQNIKTGAWEFIESTDKTFIKRHSTIARDQLQQWTSSESSIRSRALAVQANASAKTVNLALASKESLPSAGAVNRTASSMAPETIAALPVALREIFLKHHVCTLQFLCNCLRELAITKSQADVPEQEKAIAVAAAKGASAPAADLTAIIDTVATNVNGVYFLTELGDPSVDPFREVVIALLKQKPSGLQRSEIIETSKLALKKSPPNPVYQKVMKELCYTRGATWVLKTGDGRPS